MSQQVAVDPLPRIRALAERVAASYGLELFDVQFRREARGWVLRVILDRPEMPARAGPDPDSRGGPLGPPTPGPLGPPEEEGIGLRDCQRVSEELSAVLDVEDVIDHAYTLEVSSPGLDRPLRHEADYRRFTGRLAKIVVAQPVEGQTHFAGRLKGIEDRHVLVEVGRGKVKRIPFDLISRGRLDVEF